MLFTSFSQMSCGQERSPFGPRGSGLPGPDPNPADGVVCGTLWRGMQFWVRLAGGGPPALAGGGPGLAGRLIGRFYLRTGDGDGEHLVAADAVGVQQVAHC